MITYYSKKISKNDISDLKKGYFSFFYDENWISKSEFRILKIENMNKKIYSIFEPIEDKFKVLLNENTIYFFEKLKLNDRLNERKINKYE